MNVQRGNRGEVAQLRAGPRARHPQPRLLVEVSEERAEHQVQRVLQGLQGLELSIVGLGTIGVEGVGQG